MIAQPRSATLTKRGTQDNTQHLITSRLGGVPRTVLAEVPTSLRLRNPSVRWTHDLAGYCSCAAFEWRDLMRHLAFAHDEQLVAWL